MARHDAAMFNDRPASVAGGMTPAPPMESFARFGGDLPDTWHREELERDGVRETGAHRDRVREWLFVEALPLWSTTGVDPSGGFFEVLDFDAHPLGGMKRVRTMARQIYVFATAAQRGWQGPAERIVAHGVDFIGDRARSERGGFVRALDPDGSVADATEGLCDQACVLLALAHAAAAGNDRAAALGSEVFAFIDDHMEDPHLLGFVETSAGGGVRRSNPHMHLLEAFLAWHDVTGERSYLRRASGIVDLFRSHFFDADTWTVGEYFQSDWTIAPGAQGQLTEPGHHFEWVSLLTAFASRSGQSDLLCHARKLYASAVASGLNRKTGLAFEAVSKDGVPLDLHSRSWPQAEAIKAAIALDSIPGPDFKPEVESRVARLFRWHLDPAPRGLWIDRIDENGRPCAAEVPSSIFYHMVSTLIRYLDWCEEPSVGG